MTDQERLTALEAKARDQQTLIAAVQIAHNSACQKLNQHTDQIGKLDTRLTKVEKGVPVVVPSAFANFVAGLKRFVAPPLKLFAPGVALQSALMGLLLMTGTLTAPGCHGPTPPPVPPIPIPVPPVPPIPVPPIPPTPPAPIPIPGFRVLMMYDKDTLTDAQQGIVFGAQVRAYLDAKCVVGADGKTPERRIYASGVDVSGEAQWIQDLIQKHPGQKAYMVVSDGKTGYDGPLPATAEEALKILTKIGG